MAPEVLLTG